jgi:allantoate deiminase
VERHAQATPGLVATVGAIEVDPGASNCIPGEARLSLDVRHESDRIRRASAEALITTAQRIAERRTLNFEWRQLADQPAVACDPFLIGAFENAVTAAGIPTHKMPSGAGHDAMILAARVPVAMLFLRSPGGLSHHPDESVRPGDVATALAAGLELLSQLERRHA